ncbi:MAG: GtrA family protein [Gammaproteobacteria bacterium]|nr:GtrA family protein [Gammaproteobacteria bacterium]
MSKFFKWIKAKFFNKSFLSFVIIGVINTIINTFFVWFVSKAFTWVVGREIPADDSLYVWSTGIATFVAYVLASLFSYFANAHFTYNQDKKDAQTFLEAVISFGVRYGLTWVLTWAFGLLFTLILKNTSLSQETITTIANLVASVIMIPPFYFMLGFVFKRTKKRLEKKESTQEVVIETKEEETEDAINKN